MINKWLDMARWSPSGGNQQPWHVQVSDNRDSIEFTLSIVDRLKQNDSLMSAGGMAHIIALGAYAYYLKLAAKPDGYELKDIILKGANEPLNCSFKLVFSKLTEPIESQKTDLLEYLKFRRTNRLPFDDRPLSEEHFSLLKSCMPGDSSQRLFSFTSLNKDKETITQALMPIELVRWQNSLFIDGMFAELHLDGESPLDGLQPETLGVPAPVISSLRLWKKHRGIDQLFKSGLKHLLARVAFSTLVKNSSGLFFIQSRSRDQLDIFNLGMTLNRLWLELNHQGVALQIFGLPLLPYVYFHVTQEPFSSKEAKAMTETCQKLKSQYDLDFQLPTLGFRLGYCKTLAPISGRLPVSIS